MTDYIPTTNEVRDAYSSESSEPKFANRSFDLWLAKYKAKIIAQTKSQIIEELEEQSRQCEKAGLWANGEQIRGQLQELHLGLNAAIALIKGDN